MKIWYDENLSQNKKIEKSVKNKFKNSLLELKLISFLLERKKNPLICYLNQHLGYPVNQRY